MENGKEASAKVVQLKTQLVSQVGSVTIDPSSSALTLNTTVGAVALSDVRQVM